MVGLSREDDSVVVVDGKFDGDRILERFIPRAKHTAKRSLG
jgi:hypothetical protein